MKRQQMASPHTSIFLYFQATSEYIAFCYIYLALLVKSLNKHSHLLSFGYIYSICGVTFVGVSSDIVLLEQREDRTVSGKHIATI